MCDSSVVHVWEDGCEMEDDFECDAGKFFCFLLETFWFGFAMVTSLIPVEFLLALS